MRIYVASSWRNIDQPFVVAALRAAEHEVYDFKNPRPGDHGFHWKDVGLAPTEKNACPPRRLRETLKHPRAIEGFASDFGAMRWADACVLVLPCGRSAHLEAGWMAGAGKPTIVLALETGSASTIEPELMYGVTGRALCVSLDEVLAELEVLGMSMQGSATRISVTDARAVALDANVDPRSVVRFADGKPCRPTIAERIARALVARGLGHLVPKTSPAAVAETRAAPKCGGGCVLVAGHDGGCYAPIDEASS